MANPILSRLPTTIFEEMSGLAREHGAINLGQGFPDAPGPQAIAGIEARETVAGEERPVDLLLAIFPAAPLGDRGEKSFNLLLFELLAHDLFVSRARPQREPGRVGHPASAFCLAASACSYAFFSS